IYCWANRILSLWRWWVTTSKKQESSWACPEEGQDYRSQQYREDKYIEPRKNDRAEEIARERYADGEISREELEEILRTLHNN
ncbi:MAG: hypothetical protein ACQESS_10270, partial [Bacillota bacterium]